MTMLGSFRTATDINSFQQMFLQTGQHHQTVLDQCGTGGGSGNGGSGGSGGGGGSQRGLPWTQQNADYRLDTNYHQLAELMSDSSSLSHHPADLQFTPPEYNAAVVGGKPPEPRQLHWHVAATTTTSHGAASPYDIPAPQLAYDAAAIQSHGLVQGRGRLLQGHAATTSDPAWFDQQQQRQQQQPVTQSLAGDCSASLMPTIQDPMSTKQQHYPAHDGSCLEQPRRSAMLQSLVRRRHQYLADTFSVMSAASTFNAPASSADSAAYSAAAYCTETST